ncbi:MAG: ankyrin repeat domain-containing protein [Bacteroidota bacterium]
MAQNIFRTVCQGNLSRLDSLLETESLDIEDSRGRSLLHWAVGCGKKEALKYLVEKGIELNQEDLEKRTAMHVALNSGEETYFDLLVDFQPDDTWKNKYGPSLLEIALLRKNETFIKKLIAAGVDVNQVNDRGSSPLEIAKRIKADKIEALLLSLGADKDKVRQFKMQGAYMGQNPPGKMPKLFAPNFISTEESEFGSIFNAEGNAFYYAVDMFGRNEIRFSRKVGNQWTSPETILSHDRYGFNDPFLSNDENRLYFISKRALDGQGDLKDVDIWYVQREGESWSEPINIGVNINTSGNEYYISLTNTGTLYFASNINAPEDRKGFDYDIYAARSENGVFQKPVRMSEAINSEGYEADAFIAPDESYIIFCSRREDGFGRGDLYISFKQADGSWSNAQNMGEAINTPHYEYCPFVSKDGKYLFYTSKQDIYWVSTDIIKALEEKSR